jgi:hypothetical protein
MERGQLIQKLVEGTELWATLIKSTVFWAVTPCKRGLRGQDTLVGKATGYGLSARGSILSRGN